MGKNLHCAAVCGGEALLMSEVRLGSKRRAWPPYAAEGPWRWRLFNMPSQNHRGPRVTNTSFPPTPPTCPPDERGLEEGRRRDEGRVRAGLKRDNDDEPHFSPSSRPETQHICSWARTLEHGTIRFVINCECSDRTMSHSCIQNRLHLLEDRPKKFS